MRFVAETSRALVGHVGYTITAPGEASVYGLSLPWGADHVEVARALFTQSLEALAVNGVEVVEARVNPAFHDHAAEREDALRAGSFVLVQEKLRLAAPTTLDVPSFPLELRSRAKVGRSTFVDAVRETTASTLDRLDVLEIDRLGAAAHSEWYVRGLESEGVDEDRWLVAYDGERVAGVLVLGDWDEGIGLVAYVAVAPPMRGRGLGRALVAESRRRLAETGHAQALADVDVANAPMVDALRANGFEDAGEVRVHWARAPVSH